MKLRQQQIKCINAIREHFEIESNALIKIFCGAGKSFVIFDSLLRYGNNLSIIVVPFSG
jgi:superfamily II DNA or RNA helicase